MTEPRSPMQPPANVQDAAMDRRRALGAMGLAGAALLGAAGGASAQTGRRSSPLPDATPGWDARRGAYALPALPYAYDALEPHIDEATMRIHHDKHHAGYVRGLNNALKALAAIREGQGDPVLVEHWSREASFNGGGHVNHTLFWAGMAPPGAGGGGEPTGPLREAIDRDFGSFAKFALHFQAASKSVEGSGWGWLVHDPVSDRLMVLQMHNQQQMLFTGVNPLLGIDVWEHAYYLKYQNRRSDYVEAWFEVINWGEVAERFERV